MSRPEAISTAQPGPEEPTAKPRPFQFSIRQMLFWVALFARVFGMLTWCVRSSQEAARRVGCMCPLKTLGLALHNYHDKYKCFPPAYLCDDEGKPMHSWRVLILPEIEEDAAYEQYDFSEPWDGPNNRRLESVIYTSLFQCPSAPLKGAHVTSYVPVVGPQTMWPGSETRTFEDWRSCCSAHGKRVDTIMLIEIADSDIHWMEPRDLTFEQAMAGIDSHRRTGISSHHPRGVTYAAVDNSVLILEHDTDPNTLRELLVVEETDSPISEIAPYSPAQASAAIRTPGS